MESFGPALVRWVVYGAVSILVGTASFHGLVLARSVAPGLDRKAGARRTAAGWAVLAALALVVALGLVLLIQFRSFRDPFEPWQADLKLLVPGTLWGRIWLIQFLLAGLTLAAFAAARRRPAGGATWIAAGVLALASAAMPAFSGHSFSAERLPTLAIAADILHVWAAGAWLGTLLILVVVARRHAIGSVELLGTTAEWVRAFSPLALLSFATLGLSGLLASWLNIPDLPALIGSGYGRTLLLKLALIGGVAGLGAFNWKRVTPVLDTEAGERRFLKGSGSAELVLGAAVLLVTAVLVATALPLETH